MVRSIASLLPVLSLIIMPTALAEPILKVETGVAGDSNVNNGLSADGIKSDVQEYVNIDFGEVVPVGDDGSLTLSGNIEGHYFNQYEGLNNVVPGLTLAYKTKIGLGPVPWIRVSGSASRLDFRDNVRSGWLYHADFSVDKELHRQWYVTTALRLEKRVADHTVPDDPEISGAVFDQISRALTLNLDYWHDNVTVFSVGYSLRRGDVTSSVEESNDLHNKVSAITADKVFGEELYAYKFIATTQILNFSIGREVGREDMFSLRYQRRITHADNDFNYYGSTISASYMHNF